MQENVCSFVSFTNQNDIYCKYMVWFKVLRTWNSNGMSMWRSPLSPPTHTPFYQTLPLLPTSAVCFTTCKKVQRKSKSTLKVKTPCPTLQSQLVTLSTDKMLTTGLTQSAEVISSAPWIACLDWTSRQREGRKALCASHSYLWIDWRGRRRVGAKILRISHPVCVAEGGKKSTMFLTLTLSLWRLNRQEEGRGKTQCASHSVSTEQAGRG